MSEPARSDQHVQTAIIWRIRVCSRVRLWPQFTSVAEGVPLTKTIYLLQSSFSFFQKKRIVIFFKIREKEPIFFPSTILGNDLLGRNFLEKYQLGADISCFQESFSRDLPPVNVYTNS